MSYARMGKEVTSDPAEDASSKIQDAVVESGSGRLLEDCVKKGRMTVEDGCKGCLGNVESKISYTDADADADLDRYYLTPMLGCEGVRVQSVRGS